jgi:ribose transport system substrate-binding protein
MTSDNDLSRRAFLRRAGGVSLLGVAGLAAPSMLAACGGTESSTATTAAPGSTVAPSAGRLQTQFPTLNNVYWKGWNRGAEAAARALGLDVDQVTYSDSIDLQLAATEGAGAQGVSQIMMFAQNAEGSVRLIETAAGQGIYVVNYITGAAWSTPLEPRYQGFYAGLLAPVDTRGSEAMCTAIFERLGGSGKIINLNGIPGNPTATARTAGVDAALANFPGIEMVARQNGGENRVDAQPVIENLLTAHPDVDAVVCHNDDCAIAVLNACAIVGWTTCSSAVSTPSRSS